MRKEETGLQLDDRKRRILWAVIDDYVSTAAPVGSRTVSGKYISGISSATIRNEMSDLEELGYLIQPHVSAGRVPNARAYRLYVDALRERLSGEPEAEEAERIRNAFISRLRGLNDLAAEAAEALSDMTQYASAVLAPRHEALRIKSLQLVPVSRASALVVVVTDGGVFRDSVISVSDMLDADGLYAISRMLTERLRGKTLREAQQMLSVFARYAPADQQVLGGIADLAGQLARESEGESLKVAGAHRMLQHPEYADVEKARQVLAALNERSCLMELLRQDSDRSYGVHIGPECGVESLNDLSVVTCYYDVGSGHRGTLGIVGPLRMPYLKVLSTLKVAGQTLSDMLKASNNN